MRSLASLVLVLGMPILAFFSTRKVFDSPPDPGPRSVAQSKHNGVHQRKLPSGPFVVGASDPYALRFAVGDDMLKTQVVGSFSSSGDLSSDIELFLFDEDNFLSWRNGRDGQPLFRSPRTVSGHINASIPKSGAYYLVFNNDFAFLEPKTVRAEIILEYEH